MEPCPLDHDRINEFTGGDADQFRELMDLYISQTTQQLAELKTAIDTANLKGVEHLAHKAAGSSATCGMVIIAPIMREMEHQARAGSLSEAPVRFEQIQAEFEKIKAYIANHPDGK